MTNASDINRPLSSKSKDIVYLVSGYFLKNKKKDSQIPFIERTAEATGRLSSLTRVKREPYKSVDSFDQAVIQYKIINP